jgi:hypothetical protein
MMTEDAKRTPSPPSHCSPLFAVVLEALALIANFCSFCLPSFVCNHSSPYPRRHVGTDGGVHLWREQFSASRPPRSELRKRICGAMAAGYIVKSLSVLAACKIMRHRSYRIAAYLPGCFSPVFQMQCAGQQMRYGSSRPSGSTKTNAGRQESPLTTVRAGIRVRKSGPDVLGARRLMLALSSKLACAQSRARQTG